MLIFIKRQTNNYNNIVILFRLKFGERVIVLTPVHLYPSLSQTTTRLRRWRINAGIIERERVSLL